MEAKEALKHWAAWGRDLHKGTTCASLERKYASHPDRYVFKDDLERKYAFRYDRRIAEKVEDVLVSCLNKTELRILVCCDVYGHMLPFAVIARRLHMPRNSMETIRMAALNKFRRCWHG